MKNKNADMLLCILTCINSNWSR